MPIRSILRGIGRVAGVVAPVLSVVNPALGAIAGVAGGALAGRRAGQQQAEAAAQQYHAGSNPEMDAMTREKFEHTKQFWPLELELLAEARRGLPDSVRQERMGISRHALQSANWLGRRALGFEQRQARDIDIFTGGTSGIMDMFGADIEQDVGTAVADARLGQTQALNTAARQALRYGMTSPFDMQGQANLNAAQLAATANLARQEGIGRFRDLLGKRIGLNRQNFVISHELAEDALGKRQSALEQSRAMRMQDSDLDWDRRMAAVGIGQRGLQGARGLESNQLERAQLNLAERQRIDNLNARRRESRMGLLGTLAGAAVQVAPGFIDAWRNRTRPAVTSSVRPAATGRVWGIVS